MRHARQRAGDRRGAGRRDETAGEGAVELDAVERQLLEVAERGVAGAEVVERDPHAEAAQGVDVADGGVAARQEGGLGDLDVDRVRIDAVGRQCVAQERNDLRPRQVAGAEVLISRSEEANGSS